MRRVLVTGAGGFCGAAIADALSAAGDDVVATMRPGGRRPPAGLAVVAWDLNDPAAAEALVRDVRPHVCVHAAAAGARSRCDDVEELLRVNVTATAALARALGAHGALRIVTLGSSSEYGTPPGAMAEDLVPAPDDPYGVSKLAGGLMARTIARAAGPESVHLRLFSVYGPGEDADRLVPRVLQAVTARRPIDLTPGQQARDFIYVDDVVEAVALAAATPGIDGAVLNVGTGVETTVRILAETACAIAGGDPALLRFGAEPYRRGERFRWVADPRRAETVLGFRARTPLPEGLRLSLADLPAEVAA
jgi:polyisoprenyl-phosphate glycosyltransferase